MIDEEECEQLMEEYELLRRRIESTEFAEIEDSWGEDSTAEEALSNSDLDVDPEDIRRLDEIKRKLEVECGEDMPGDDDAVDIPDYLQEESAR